MKTSELTGPALDCAVAIAHGGIHQNGEGRYHDWSPSTRWEQGGPIIEREDISVVTDEDDWSAHTVGGFNHYGPTPLIAAMRCYVASVLGDEVEIPEELKELA